MCTDSITVVALLAAHVVTIRRQQEVRTGVIISRHKNNVSYDSQIFMDWSLPNRLNVGRPDRQG